MARRRTRTRTSSIQTLRKFAPALVLLVPVLGYAAWLALAFAADNAGKLRPILKEYGYTALTPPSRFFGPGTFIMVEPLDDGTVKLHLACNMDQEALASLWQRSKTLNQSFVTKVRDSFEASADAWQLVNANARGTVARDVDVALRDISIVTMPHESLFSVRAKYLQGSCEEAIIWNLRAGASICQTEEALEADVLYSARSEDDLAGDGSLRPPQNTASIKAGRQSSNENQAEGDDLILGVRVRAANCFFLAKDGEHISKSASVASLPRG
jgi:hypothetical protein